MALLAVAENVRVEDEILARQSRRREQQHGSGQGRETREHGAEMRGWE